MVAEPTCPPRELRPAGEVLRPGQGEHQPRPQGVEKVRPEEQRPAGALLQEGDGEDVLPGEGGGCERTPHSTPLDHDDDYIARLKAHEQNNYHHPDHYRYPSFAW